MLVHQMSQKKCDLYEDWNTWHLKLLSQHCHRMYCFIGKKQQKTTLSEISTLFNSRINVSKYGKGTMYLAKIRVCRKISHHTNCHYIHYWKLRNGMLFKMIIVVKWLVSVHGDIIPSSSDKISGYAQALLKSVAKMTLTVIIITTACSFRSGWSVEAAIARTGGDSSLCRLQIPAWSLLDCSRFCPRILECTLYTWQKCLLRLRWHTVKKKKKKRLLISWIFVAGKFWESHAEVCRNAHCVLMLI